jgi:hypothetical protein
MEGHSPHEAKEGRTSALERKTNTDAKGVDHMAAKEAMSDGG